MSVTPRDCFLNVMRYETPPRMFNWNRPFGFYAGVSGTQFWHATVERWHTEGLPADRDTPQQINDYVNADRSLRIVLRVDVWPPHPKQVVEENEEFEIFYDADGALVRQYKGMKYESAMPEHLEYAVTSRQDWERFRAERLDPDAPGRDHFTLELDGQTLIESAPGAKNFDQACQMLMQSRWPVEITIGSLYGYMRNRMGVTALSYALYDDEGLVQEMIDHQAQLGLSIVRRFLEAARVPVDYATWWEDMAYNKGPLIAPKHIKRLMVPNYQRVNAYLRSQGVDFIGVDSDGNLDKIIPHWLDGGLNFVYPNEVAAGNDVMAIRRKYGREMRLFGGIDKRVLSQDAAAIRAELDRRLPLVADGGYLPSIDHSVPPDVPFENYMRYLKLYSAGCQRYLS